MNQQAQTNGPVQTTPARITIDMWTDGACSGNPGAGGWAAILKMGAHEKELSGRLENTTNNLAELMAVLKGLQVIKTSATVLIHTDSRLVVGWLRDNWRRKDTECGALSAAIERAITAKTLTVEWVEVKGHSGDKMNERCDKLATKEAQAQRITQIQNAVTYDSEPSIMELPY